MKITSKYATLATVVLSLGLVACGDETKVSVTDHAGMALSNATVTMDGQTLSTDSLGNVTIAREGKAASKISTLAIQAPGYITQSLEIEAVDPRDEIKRSLSATLKAKAPVQKIEDISSANTVSNEDGSVFVDFTPNSFVKQDGTPVTGAAEVSITPWYPTDSGDMAAFLGDGYAQDLQGNMGQLISYGAMTVQFTQNGEKLQLALGKTAKISMPLSFDQDYDGSDMAAGKTIPMWHFDENKGFWKEEGQGQVTENAEGKRVLVAEVAHFTTWNWDMQVENSATVSVKCQLPSGKAVACNVSGVVKYNNGAETITSQSTVPATGSDMINLDPNLDSITFTATYYDENGNQLGGKYVTKGVPSNVTIILDKVYSNVAVKCQLPNGKDVPCWVEMRVVEPDGTDTNKSSYIQDPSGAVIKGIHPKTKDLTFSGLYTDSKNKTVYEGSLSFNKLPTSQVVVILDKQVDIAKETIFEIDFKEDEQAIGKGWDWSKFKGLPEMGNIDVDVAFKNPGKNVVYLDWNQYSIVPIQIKSNSNLTKGFKVILNQATIAPSTIHPEATYTIRYGLKPHESHKNILNVVKYIKLKPVKSVETLEDIVGQ